MSSAEESVRTICNMTKALLEHHIGTMPQVLVRLDPNKSEVHAALWLPIDKAMKRLTLTMPSVAEFQEVASSSEEL